MNFVELPELLAQLVDGKRVPVITDHPVRVSFSASSSVLFQTNNSGVYLHFVLKIIFDFSFDYS